MKRLFVLLLLAIIASLAAYIILAYFTPRQHFSQVVTCFAFAFAAYFFLTKYPFKAATGILMALGFRLLFLFATPALSDDYYRFVWDGKLITHSENPYQHLPSHYIKNSEASIPGLTENLYQKLNSPGYFSVYPPVCQFIFASASYVGGKNLWLNCLVLRLFILAAEFLTLLLLLRILRLLELPEKQLWLYAFNPLIIVELTGNLHFEALLILGIISSFYFYLKQKYAIAAILLGLAIGVKLIPLIFMPFILKDLGLKRFCWFGSIVAVTIIGIFLPFLTPVLLQNIYSSLDLYFQKFEFNASIYYIFRWIGIQIKGYNPIASIGPLLSLLTFLGVLLLTWFSKIDKKKLPVLFLFSLSLYLFFATTVHPWYITTLVALGVFSNWRFPIVWSGMVILSYATYKDATYTENLWLVALEYILVGAVLIYEITQKYKIKTVDNKLTI